MNSRSFRAFLIFQKEVVTVNTSEPFQEQRLLIFRCGINKIPLFSNVDILVTSENIKRAAVSSELFPIYARYFRQVHTSTRDWSCSHSVTKKSDSFKKCFNVRRSGLSQVKGQAILFILWTFQTTTATAADPGLPKQCQRMTGSHKSASLIII